MKRVLKDETFMQIQDFYEKKIASGEIRVENMKEFYSGIEQHLKYYCAKYLENRVTFIYNEKKQRVVQYVNLWGGNPETVHLKYMGGYNNNKLCMIVSLQDLFAYLINPEYESKIEKLIDVFLEKYIK